MITLEFDLQSMNARQIATLDAALVEIRQTPSSIMNKVTDAGQALVGVDEYERLYQTIHGAIDDAKSTIKDANQ